MLPHPERDFLLNAMYVSCQRAQALWETRQQVVATGANTKPIGVYATKSHFTKVQLLGGNDDDDLYD